MEVDDNAIFSLVHVALFKFVSLTFSLIRAIAQFILSVEKVDKSYFFRLFNIWSDFQSKFVRKPTLSFEIKLYQ